MFVAEVLPDSVLILTGLSNPPNAAMSGVFAASVLADEGVAGNSAKTRPFRRPMGLQLFRCLTGFHFQRVRFPRVSSRLMPPKVLWGRVLLNS